MPSNRNPVDTYEVVAPELDSPARFAYSIDPSVYPQCNTSVRGLYIGTSGNVYCRPTGLANNINIVYLGGEHANVFFYNVVAGTILPVRIDAVWEGKFDQA